MNGIRTMLMKRNKENRIKAAIKTGNLKGLTTEDIKSVDPALMRSIIAKAYRQILVEEEVDYLG